MWFEFESTSGSSIVPAFKASASFLEYGGGSWSFVMGRDMMAVGGGRSERKDRRRRGRSKV